MPVYGCSAIPVSGLNLLEEKVERGLIVPNIFFLCKREKREERVNAQVFSRHPLDEHRRERHEQVALGTNQNALLATTVRTERIGHAKEIATPFGNIFVGSKLFDGLHVRNDLPVRGFRRFLFFLLEEHALKSPDPYLSKALRAMQNPVNIETGAVSRKRKPG